MISYIYHYYFSTQYTKRIWNKNHTILIKQRWFYEYKMKMTMLQDLKEFIVPSNILSVNLFIYAQ